MSTFERHPDIQPQPQPSETTDGSWTIDTETSRAEFRVRGVFGHWVRGTIPIRDATVRAASPGTRPRSIEARLDPAGVSTGNDKRDQHLRSADFFDVASQPEWRFVSGSIRSGDGGWQVEGSLTVRGTTRPVHLAVRPPDDSGRIVATTTLDRRAFGVTWGPRLAVGHQVHVTIEAKLRPSEPPPAD